ncbi:MAG: 2-hydroxychromene-2-carboxylate isomerase [Oleiphilaceae bacterium]|jgi:2-hydroxychromene-2-carboxylate isomerase
MNKAVMPYLSQAISSDLFRDIKRQVYLAKRKLQIQPATLDIFLKTDDPYSYLLLQALPSIEKRFKVTFKFHVFQEINSDMFPRLDMWLDYTKRDAYHLAKLYDFRFPSKDELPGIDKEITHKLSLALVNIETDEAFISKAIKLLDQYWFQGISPALEDAWVKQNQQKLTESYELLTKRGHYLGAMINFEGEWYWGLDRLDHLEKRLIGLCLAHAKKESIHFDRTYKAFCKAPSSNMSGDKQTPLILYWSARSPYSYIALERAIMLTAHYKIPLLIKPVLPMMMRGMNVPDTKKFYIFLDTKREASKLDLPYGCVADPLGAAVERCYSLVEYAKSEDKYHDFLLSFATAVNSQGIRAETDKGLKTIVTRCGLDWNIAKHKLVDQSWRVWADKNLEKMYSVGCWGVPTICYGDSHFWGQDRFGIIENHILKRQSKKN